MILSIEEYRICTLCDVDTDLVLNSTKRNPGSMIRKVNDLSDRFTVKLTECESSALIVNISLCAEISRY